MLREDAPQLGVEHAFQHSARRSLRMLTARERAQAGLIVLRVCYLYVTACACGCGWLYTREFLDGPDKNRPLSNGPKEYNGP